jgi:hypothetical protein
MVRLASLAAAGALLGSTAVVAAEPVELTSGQLDGVTAGFDIFVSDGAAAGGALAAAVGLISGSATDSDAEVTDDGATANGDASAFSIFGGGTFTASGSLARFTTVDVGDFEE